MQMEAQIKQALTNSENVTFESMYRLRMKNLTTAL